MDYYIENEKTFTKKDINSNIDISSILNLTGVYNMEIIHKENFTCYLFGDLHVASEIGFECDNSTTNQLKTQKDNSDINDKYSYTPCDYTKTMYLPIYLDLLFKKYPNKQFDLMIEKQYNKWEKPSITREPNDVIDSIINQFEPCFNNYTPDKQSVIQIYGI